MNWQGLFTGLGNAGDILAGKESFNSIKRGNRAQDLQQQYQGWQANNADANRAQEGMMQEAGFGQQTKLQQEQQAFLKAMETLRQIQEMDRLQKQQEFMATQNQADRGWRTDERIGTQLWHSGEAGLDRRNAMDRTMAPLKFQEEHDPMNQPIDIGEIGLFGEQGPSLIGLTPNRLNAIGRAGIGAATASDPFANKAFGNSLVQRLNAENTGRIIDQFGGGLGAGLSVNPFANQRGPGGMPVQRPVVQPGSPQQRKGNY